MALLSREFFRCLTRRLTDGHHEAAREFWETGQHDDEDDHYWGAQPMVRRAINRRITGDPDLWPMDWFARRYAASPAELGLSIGCGEGLLERDVIAKGICA